ncbi:MAG TPA: HYR domain-containing protein [Thermoanaerobaculia bacterium]|jgi:hypothetical protein
MGGTITSIDPASIPYRSGEYFLTVNGTSLGDHVIFESASGSYDLEVNATFNGSVVAWIPEDVVNDPGTYSVYTKNGLSQSNKVTFTVTKPGGSKLTLHLPEHLLAIAKSRLGTGIKYDVSATGPDTSISIKCSPESGSTFPFGQSEIICTGSDNLGNEDRGSISVTVWDGTAPALTLPKSFEVPSEDDKGAYVKFDASAIDDIDGQLRVTCSRDSGTFFPNGRTTVNCEALDNSLNPATGSFDVFVQPRDIGKLALKVPDKAVGVATEKEGGEVVFEVTAYGSADPDPFIECDPPSGWFFSMGRTKVYCKAEDDFGARAEAGFEVEVVERLGLKLPDVTAEAMSPTGTEVTFDAVAEDWTNAVRCSPGSGSLFNLGETTVDCESTDDKGRRAGGTFKVNVADTIAPHIGRIKTITGIAQGDMIPLQVEVETTDAGDVMPRCSVTALTADNGGTLDASVKGDLDVEVRDGRPFHLQVTCTDASGNRSTGSIPVMLGATKRRQQIAN